MRPAVTHCRLAAGRLGSWAFLRPGGWQPGVGKSARLGRQPLQRRCCAAGVRPPPRQKVRGSARRGLQRARAVRMQTGCRQPAPAAAGQRAAAPHQQEHLVRLRRCKLGEVAPLQADLRRRAGRGGRGGGRLHAGGRPRAGAAPEPHRLGLLLGLLLLGALGGGPAREGPAAVSAGALRRRGMPRRCGPRRGRGLTWCRRPRAGSTA